MMTIPPFFVFPVFSLSAFLTLTGPAFSAPLRLHLTLLRQQARLPLNPAPL